MANVILKTVNANGIPCIESNNVSVGTNSVVFYFSPHQFLKSNFSGLIAVKISQSFTTPTNAVPIQFVTENVSNSTITLKTFNNADLTTADWSGTGIYLAFYDRGSNTLQLINGIV